MLYGISLCLEELFEAFCDQVGLFVKQTISEKGGHK